MSFDTRARHAVRSVQDSVVRVSPVGMPAVTRRHRASLIAGLAGALAIAFASIALASMLPDSDPGDTANVNPNIPDPEIPDGELVVLPEGGGGDVEEGIHQKNETSDSADPYTQFYGTADPGTVVVASSPYGTADLEVGESGEFSLKLFFEGAPSGFTFPVTLTVGDVEYQFEFTCLWDPDNIALTAHQAYGSSDSATPYEKFFGTAPPGTAVHATSAYGSADTEASEHGEWYLKLWFEGQPVGEPFDITVTVGDDTFTFSFVWLQEEGLTGEISVVQEGTSSNSSSPYTRFVGTAPAGTHVLATSAYGSADLEVGESGEFSLKVWFTNAPAGVKFPITLKINHEYYATYYFKSYWTPGPVGLTLTQYNTESWDPAPWVKFYGTAAPGTVLFAQSEYGSADMVVGESGEVYFKLYFSTLPPAGVEFPVTLKVNGDVYGTYPFTSWSDGSVETTVNQHNTESDTPEPYVKFYGTAPIGTEIQIISPYGSTTWNTESVEWLNKLWFAPLPPAGETFEVTVKVNGEVWGTYSFTSWYAAPVVDITAHNTLGTSNLDPPYDVYYGTAPAGTGVTITSPYSEPASTTANGDGGWEKQVFFSGAPLNEAFTVTVTVGDQTFYFGMVVTTG